MGDSYLALGYLIAYSEAAMLGAIADWFAETAWLRHPIGTANIIGRYTA
jgi:uncharacterized membrane-anchored protein YjiN (DUF445 family)